MNKYYKVVGTNRTTGENEEIYSGKNELDLSDNNNFTDYPGKNWSCLQQLENGELKNIRFLEEEAPRPWWQKIF
jgi:hypothetical protein